MACSLRSFDHDRISRGLIHPISEWIAGRPSRRNAIDMTEAVRENADLTPISGNAKMKFDDVILGRRSIRGYKPDPVPQDLVKEILGLAMRAPSSMNTQPWN